MQIAVRWRDQILHGNLYKHEPKWAYIQLKTWIENMGLTVERPECVHIFN